MGSLAAIANEGGEETERAAGALEAAFGLTNSDQRDIEQFRRERETLAKLIGVIGRDVDAESTPGVQVTLNDRVYLGGRGERGLFEQAMKQDFATVGRILKTEFDARDALQREAGLKIAVVDGGDEQDVRAGAV